MKQNGMLLVVYAMLAFIMTAGIMMGDIISWEGLMCWSLSFSFWFLMLIGAWSFKDKLTYCKVAKRNCNGCLTQCKAKGHKCPPHPSDAFDLEWENDVRRGR